MKARSIRRAVVLSVVASTALAPPTAAVAADGTLGAETSHLFQVARPAPAVGTWTLETDGWGSDPFEDGHGDNDLTASGVATLEPDARVVGASTAAFDGTGLLTTSGPVARTDESFTLSAWAALDGLGEDGTVIGLDGLHTNAGAIEYVAATESWCFGLGASDSAASSRWRACSAATTEWTHLTGAYDAVAGDLRLYVDGVLAAVEPVLSGMWNATGPLSVGRDFVGHVSGLRVHSRTVDPREIREGFWDYPPLMQPVRTGAWWFDSDCCGSAFDYSYYGHDLVLGPNTSFAESGPGYGLRTNGDTATTGPVVRTDAAFTVAATVAADGLHGDSLVLSQDAAGPNGLSLGYRHDLGAWCFTLAGTQACADQPATGEWERLAGVHDPVADEIRLYADGDLVASAGHVAPQWSHGGGFALGGTPVFEGVVDNVYAYFGALTQAEIATLGI